MQSRPDPWEAWGNDDGESGPSILDGVPAVVGGYNAAPGYRNDDRDYRVRQEELREQQEEENQQIGKAVATLQAKLFLLSLLKDNAETQNELKAGETDLPIGAELPLESSMPSLSRGMDDMDPSPFDGVLGDGNLLYTEGGLVFRNQPQRNFRAEEPGVGPEGLTFLKRFADAPDSAEWGPLQLDQGDQDIVVPLDNDLGYGNEDEEGYGYDFASPLFLLNRRARDGFGFQRRERLDVKKPGPWYRTVNNYAFDKDDNEQNVSFSQKLYKGF